MSNLDDFFKKRDKKKKTAKSKFSTLDTEELAKNLESSASKGGDDDFDFQEGTERASNAQGNDHLDDEWKPFDSDENRDYTGLRINIQNLKVEDENDEFSGTIDENEKKTACPWGAPSAGQNRADDTNQHDDDEPANEAKPAAKSALSDTTNQKTAASVVAADTAKPESAQSEPAAKSESSGSAPSAYIPPALRRQQQQQQQQPTPEPKPAPSAESSSGTSAKYIPPSLRNKTAESSGSGLNSGIPTTSVNYRRPNKSQPNINDTMEFPTLDAAVSDGKPSDKVEDETSQKFEFAKKAARIEPKGKDNSIDLQNKFTALSNN